MSKKEPSRKEPMFKGKARTILLMRHAKSSWDEPELPDHDRSLNKRGRKAAALMGQELKSRGLVPDIIVTSTARRAAQTTELLVEASGFQGEILSTSRLYLAEPSNYYDLFTEVPFGTQRALFVAHNPGISELVERMTSVSQGMCTAGIAQIECEVGEIAQIDGTTSCTLTNFFRPPRE